MSTESGCPSFVSEESRNGLQRHPEAIADTHRYVLNIAAWLSAPGQFETPDRAQQEHASDDAYGALQHVFIASRVS